MKLLVLDQRQFNGLLDATPALARKLLAAMATRLPRGRRQGHGGRLSPRPIRVRGRTRCETLPVRILAWTGGLVSCSTGSSQRNSSARRARGHRRRRRHGVLRLQAVGGLGLLWELLRRRRRHRPGLRPRAAGSGLRHRPDLRLPRQPGGDARVRRVRPHEARGGRGLPAWRSSPAGSRAPPVLRIFTTSPATAAVRPGPRRPTAGARTRHLHINAGGAFLVEVILTSSSCWSCSSPPTRRPSRGPPARHRLGLVVVHLIGIPLTGTSVNPARSLGPALIVGGTALNQVWLFIVAPVGRRHHRCAGPPAAGRPLPGRARPRRAARGRPSLRRRGRAVRPLPSEHGSAHRPRLRPGPRQGVLATIRANGRPQLSNILFVPGEGETPAHLGHGGPGQDSQPAA